MVENGPQVEEKKNDLREDPWKKPTAPTHTLQYKHERMLWWISCHLSKEEKSVMLRLRQKELLWMGLESQEERLRWLDSELNRLKLSKELKSVPVVQELADEGEGLGPRWKDIALK